MKLKLLLLSILMLGIFQTQAQTTITIGSGSLSVGGSNGLPVYRSSAGSSFDYSQNIMLYSQAELNAAGVYNGAVISSIAFYKTDTNEIVAGETANLNVDMGNAPISLSSLDTSDTYANLTSGFTSAFSGTVDNTLFAPVAGPVTITFQNPFTYTGGAIMIGMNWDISAVSGNPTTGSFSWAYDNSGTEDRARGNSNSSTITLLSTAVARLFQVDITYTGGTPPTCPQPSDLTASNITATGADLGWTENGTASVYDVEIVPTGTAPTGTATDPGVANPFTASSLTPATNYDYYVRAVCGVGDESYWIGPFSFLTSCVAVTDFNENFDGVSTPDLPICWSSFVTTPAGTTAAVVGTSTAGDNSPANGVRLYSGSLTGNIGSGTTDEGETILISPLLSNLAAGTHRLKFFADAGTATSTVEVGTMTDPTDPATFTSIATFTPTTTHAEYIQDFSSYSGSDQYIAFRHIFAGTFDSMYLDDIVWEPIPACLAATDLALQSATDTTVTIGWTNNAGAAASSVIYGPAGFDPLTAGTTVAGGADTATITGLTAETDYDFYVTQDCSATGDGLSAQAGPLSIQTPCAAIAAPYFVDFENFTAATSGFTSDQCWNEVSPTLYDWAIDGAGGTTSSNTGPSGAYSGTTFMFVEASNGADGDVATVQSPAVDLSALTTPSVSFYYHMYGAFITDLTVGISTDNGATFTNELTITGQQQTADTDPWIQAIIDLSSYAGQSVILSLTTTKGTGSFAYEGDVSIDDVNFDELPSCLDPTMLSATNITPTSADLSWTDSNGATLFDVEIVTAGTAPTSTPTNAGVSNPFSVSTLTANTAYEFYVRADCGTGTSGFVGPFQFTTPCAAIAAPYTEDFETFTTSTSAFTGGNCWSGSGGTYYWEAAPGTDTSSNDTGPAPSITTGNYFFTEATSGSLGDTTDLNSPMVDLTALTAPALLFDYHMYGVNMGTLDVLVNGTTSVWSLSGEQQTAETEPWGKAVIDLSAYAGQTISVTFRGTKGASYESDMAIDNVEFTELPTDTVDWANLQSTVVGGSAVSTMETCQSVDVYAQAYEPGVTDADAAAAGAGIEVWIAISDMDTDPATWDPSLWTVATYNTDVGNNDEFTVNYSGLTAGTYYMASRWRLNFGPFVYGATNGPWDGTSNNNATFTVTDPVLVTATSNNSVICEGESAMLTATSASSDYTYVWDDSAATTGASVTVTPTETTTYTVTGTNSVTGCATTASVTVNVNPAPSALTITPDPADLCEGGDAVELMVTGGNDPVSIVSEGFESTVPPAGWASFIGTNGVGTVQDWKTSTTSNTGSQAAFCQWENVTGGLAEDWLVTDMIDLTDYTNASLSFFTRQAFSSDFGSNYYVRVSTTSQTDVTSFTDVQTWDESTLNAAYNVYEEKMVDLSAYDGQQIYIAFVLINDDGDSWFIDDVSVTGLDSNLTYTWSPSTDLYTDAAATTAYAGESLTTVYAKPSATTTYTATATSAAGCTTDAMVNVTVNAAPTAPTVPTIQEFCSTAGATVADLVATGNNIMWYDAPTGGAMLASTDALADGMVYYASQSDATTGCESVSRALTVVDFDDTLCPPANDDCANAESLPLNAAAVNGDTSNATGAMLTTCGDGMSDGVWYTVTGNDGDDYTIDVSPTGWDAEISVFTGDCTTGFTCVANADDNGMDGLESVTFTTATATVYYIVIGSNDGVTEGPFNITASTTAGNGDVSFDAGITLYPNPVQGDMVTINLGDNAIDTASVSVYNSLGQQVITREFNNISNGVIELNNMSSLSTGVYLVNISSGDQTATRRFIKQ